ncbi:hypothetical protein BDA96_05G182100 [Sorghum bicolor]|uniref:Uncharacterized protein n=1 Tax=Sorghum bicolor TaxID=4558 RepID=A0A921R0X4_SORBI|nr:hypothetical protein BDA96_05G182100 [Sorghum bicolor]
MGPRGLSISPFLQRSGAPAGSPLEQEHQLVEEEVNAGRGASTRNFVCFIYKYVFPLMLSPPTVILVEMLHLCTTSSHQRRNLIGGLLLFINETDFSLVQIGLPINFHATSGLATGSIYIKGDQISLSKCRMKEIRTTYHHFEPKRKHQFRLKEHAIDFSPLGRQD